MVISEKSEKKPFLIRRFFLILTLFLSLSFVSIFALGYPIYFKPEQDRLYVAYDDGMVEVWNTTSALLIKTFSGKELEVYGATKDGANFYLGGMDGNLYILDLKGGSITKFNLSRGVVTSLLLDGESDSLYFGSQEGEIGIFNMQNKKIEKLVNVTPHLIRAMFLQDY